MPVPNQRTITFKAPPKAEKEFVWIEKDDLSEASKYLTPAQLLVYIDFCGNKDGYTKDFSPAYYEEAFHMTKQTARGAFDRMKEVGYLYKKSENNDLHYIFRRRLPRKEDN